MKPALNKIHHQDCLAGMAACPEGSVDLAFADPPFNIGYEYDVYQDRLKHEAYLDWSREWISGVHRVLKPTGTFWLAIGDEYAAELKVIAQETGFLTRSWVIWYYTFGVNCKRKFSRSHAHLFYFVKSAKEFTFHEDQPSNRIPSARQLVYNDKRANPHGRLPDDTWILRPSPLSPSLFTEFTENGEVDLGRLAPFSESQPTWTLRPQDVDACFRAEEDTWYFPRVAGTFKERAGFHGCQMPEQLLGRIVRCCSNPGDLVLDPFSGSATTLAVAKKLGRNYLGFDLSPDYIEQGRQRLEKIRVGDRLDGAAEPLVSAPKTGADKNLPAKKAGRGSSKAAPSAAPTLWNNKAEKEKQYAQEQLELTFQQIREAYDATSGGCSALSLLCDPERQRAFVQFCQDRDVVGDEWTWNTLLLRLEQAEHWPSTGVDFLSERAADKDSETDTTDWEQRRERVAFAAEIAFQWTREEAKGASWPEVLCRPALRSQFEERAAALAGKESTPETLRDFRWAVTWLLQQAPAARGRGQVLWAAHGAQIAAGWLEFSLNPGKGKAVAAAEKWPDAPGLYLLCGAGGEVLYAGETDSLRTRLTAHLAGSDERKKRVSLAEPLPVIEQVRYYPLDQPSEHPLAWPSALATEHRPRLNLRELHLGE